MTQVAVLSQAPGRELGALSISSYNFAHWNRKKISVHSQEFSVLEMEMASCPSETVKKYQKDLDVSWGRRCSRNVGQL